MQARYYDPVIGRFYSNDPVDTVGHLGGLQGVQGFNRYAYVSNNPYKFIDPNGEAGYYAAFPEQEKAARQVMGKLAKATAIKGSVGLPGLAGNFKSPNSPLSAHGGISITGGATIDDKGLSVNVAAEVAVEASDSQGNSASLQLVKAEASLTNGNTTETIEGPKVDFTSASGGTAQSDGVLKIGGKIGFVKVEIEIDTKKLIE